jgi:hypothetical protein
MRPERNSKFTKSPERESVPSLPLSVPAILLFSGPVQASQSALVARFVFCIGAIPLIF